MLTKIKAEIMKLDFIDEDKAEGTDIEPMVFLDEVLEIIDKYIVEVENKE